MLFLSLFSIIFTFCSVVEANYCDSSLCSSGVKHIGCSHDGSFHKSCPQDRAMIALSSADVQIILDTHNSLRNRVATGAEPNFKTASKMATMFWSEELAALATLNVKQCKMEHDSCRNTFKHKYVGQNLGYRSNSEGFEALSTFLPGVINMWYDEIKDASQSSLDTCCGGSNFTKIGHFLQVVQDRAGLVGCAAARYTNPNSKASKTILLACNYSYANVVGQKVYETGSPASACSNGRNTKFTGLCN